MTEQAQQRLRVGIVMGGMSSEREVSLESGRNIFNKIDRRKYDPLALFMDSRAGFWEIPVKLLMRNSTRDVEEDLAALAVPVAYEALAARVDILFLGLHGKYGEDGCVQGLLELLGIPYTGSGVLASALGMDKDICRRLLGSRGIAVPKAVSLTREAWEERQGDLCGRIGSEIGYPCVVKPTREGCSTAVTKVPQPEGLASAVAEALRWDDRILVEECLRGMEVTCGVLGNDDPVALTPSETIPTAAVLSLEDKFLYGQGENKTPARLPDPLLRKVQETAVRTFRALRLQGYARIDMFVLDDERVVVLEPNTLPGMTPSTVLFHQAAASGWTPAAWIDRIVQLALEAHARKRGPL